MKCWLEFCSNCESNSWCSWLQILLNYLKISKHLHILFSATPATNGGPAKVSSANSNLIDRIENDIHRMRRTIYLLISMGLVFCVCWLPLNIVNLVSLPLHTMFSRSGSRLSTMRVQVPDGLFWHCLQSALQFWLF